MVMEFTSEELDLLRELVAESVREIGPEIHHTDSREYRAELKARQERLRTLQHRLAATEAVRM